MENSCIFEKINLPDNMIDMINHYFSLFVYTGQL